MLVRSSLSAGRRREVLKLGASSRLSALAPFPASPRVSVPLARRVVGSRGSACAPLRHVIDLAVEDGADRHCSLVVGGSAVDQIDDRRPVLSDGAPAAVEGTRRPDRGGVGSGVEPPRRLMSSAPDWRAIRRSHTPSASAPRRRAARPAPSAYPRASPRPERHSPAAWRPPLPDC